MPVSEALELIKAQGTLQEIREHRGQAQDAEDALCAVLAQLLYQEVELVYAEAIGGPRTTESSRKSVQFRHFGEIEWSSNTGEVPRRGLMVGFDVVDGGASITLASPSQRCEYLFDLTFFDVRLVNTDR